MKGGEEESSGREAVVAPFALTVSSNRPFSWVVRIAHKHSSIERLERTQQCDPR